MLIIRTISCANQAGSSIVSAFSNAISNYSTRFESGGPGKCILNFSQATTSQDMYMSLHHLEYAAAVRRHTVYHDHVPDENRS